MKTCHVTYNRILKRLLNLYRQNIHHSKDYYETWTIRTDIFSYRVLIKRTFDPEEGSKK